MPRKRFLALMVFFCSVATPWFALAAETDALRTQRAQVASLLAIGQLLPDSEIATLAREAESYEAAKQAIESRSLSKSQRALVFEYAYRDVFGEAPTKSDSRFDGTYLEALRENLKTLEADAADYEAVIERAYRFVIQRAPYKEEISYWKERGTFPYVLLVGGVEDWARRNQPGLMVTAGEATINVNCLYLTTVRLDPKLAAEVREAEKLEASKTIGDAIVYPSASGFISMGNVPFALCGSASRDS